MLGSPKLPATGFQLPAICAGRFRSAESRAGSRPAAWETRVDALVFGGGFGRRAAPEPCSRRRGSPAGSGCRAVWTSAALTPGRGQRGRDPVAAEGAVFEAEGFAGQRDPAGRARIPPPCRRRCRFRPGVEVAAAAAGSTRSERQEGRAERGQDVETRLLASVNPFPRGLGGGIGGRSPGFRAFPSRLPSLSASGCRMGVRRASARSQWRARAGFSPASPSTDPWICLARNLSEIRPERVALPPPALIRLEMSSDRGNPVRIRD